MILIGDVGVAKGGTMFFWDGVGSRGPIFEGGFDVVSRVFVCGGGLTILGV